MELQNTVESKIALWREMIQKQGIATQIVESNSEIGLSFTSFLQASPVTREEIETLLKLAKQENFSLYPISRGRNLGYGYNFPCQQDQVVVDLSKFNKISDYDPELGEVRIETGVTQEELYLFLQDKPFLMDSTGAGPVASVLGNALDGGIGYSPYGAKRYSVFDLEVLLPDGNIVKTGHPFAVGPSLTPLFIQGNFGIVLSGKLRLFPKPECLWGLIIQIKTKEGLPKVLEELKRLKTSGEVKNIIHFGNPMRIFMSSMSLQDPKYSHLLDKDYITETDIQSGYYWTGYGALMGDRDLIGVYRRKIHKTIGKYARIILMDERKIWLLRRLVTPFLPGLETKLKGVEQLIKLQSGYPTPKPWENIRWRYESIEKTGIIWVGVLLPNKSAVISSFVDKLQDIFNKARFECPLTLSLFEPQSLVGIITILYSRLDTESQQRAHNLYTEVLTLVETEGLSLYRQAILPGYTAIPSDKLALLKSIKQGVDTQGIIAPGKYGI